jgi:Holliday junction DNA helicase RuvA
VYDYLEGQVAQHATTRLVVDVGGIGYELSVPLGPPWPVGQRTRVWTHLIVRDDAHLLYGFPDADTREVFRTLLKVKGVGPRVALGILSGLPRRELIEAIAQGDRRRLLALKGVGRKIVDQVLLDLGERAQALLAAERTASGQAPPAPAGPRPGLLDDAIAALVSIGYAEKDARKQVERVATDAGEAADLEQLVRAALAG